jgi:hypothetical protein
LANLSGFRRNERIAEQCACGNAEEVSAVHIWVPSLVKTQYRLMRSFVKDYTAIRKMQKKWK